MRKGILILFLWSATFIHFIRAQPGSLDASFGTSGIVTTSIGNSTDRIEALTEQTNGMVVVAGKTFNGTNYDIAVARYTTTGNLDNAFGTGGIVTLPVGNDIDEAYGVALQNDQKIVICGITNNGTDYDFCVIRLLTDGTPDSTFDSDGIVVTPISGSFDFATDVAIQPDGKILVAGYVYIGSGYDFAIVRYKADGSLDNTFNGTGLVTTDLSGNSDQAQAMALQSDGKIILAGSSGSDCAAARYNTNGTLDNTFNGTGKVITNLAANNDMANDVLIQPDGKIILAGSAQNSSGTVDFGVLRYLSDGSLDMSFDGDGKIVTSFFAGDDQGFAAALQPDGKLVVGGFSHNGSDNDFALIRYNANGSQDLSFNSTGKVVTTIGTGTESITDVIFHQNGKILVAGYADMSSVDFALARYISGVTIGVDESVNALQVKVYPNPASQICNLDFTTGEAGDYNLSLIDISGREIALFRKRSFPSGEHSVKFRLPEVNGVYTLVLTGNNLIFRSQIVVSH